MTKDYGLIISLKYGIVLNINNNLLNVVFLTGILNRKNISSKK